MMVATKQCVWGSIVVSLEITKAPRTKEEARVLIDDQRKALQAALAAVDAQEQALGLQPS